MTINLTNLTSADSISEVAIYSNNVTSGLLFTGFLLVLWVVITLAFLKNARTTANAIAASSWICVIVSALFMGAGIEIPLFFLFLIGAAIGTFFSFVEDSP